LIVAESARAARRLDGSPPVCSRFDRSLLIPAAFVRAKSHACRAPASDPVAIRNSITDAGQDWSHDKLPTIGITQTLSEDLRCARSRRMRAFSGRKMHSPCTTETKTRRRLFNGRRGLRERSGIGCFDTFPTRRGHKYFFETEGSPIVVALTQIYTRGHEKSMTEWNSRSG